jgi:two-component system aerobic respiration control sensor histidine kinase ArcB
MEENTLIKPLRSLAHYYVHLLSRLGVVRFSLSLAAVIILVVLLIQVSVTFALTGSVSSTDLVRSVFFGLIITPWAVFFMSVVVEQLEESRQRLTLMIRKLETMRARDQELNERLKSNIRLLNSEIDGRTKAQQALQTAMKDVKQEVHFRVKAQQDLEERSILLRSFIDSSPDLVYYRNEQGQFSGCNRAMEELTGRSERELIGLTPFDVYDSDVATKISETDREVFERDGGVTYVQWITYPNGRKSCFELRKVPFYSSDGSRLGLLGFGRDITELKQYQDSLEQASRDKTQFISTLSHELRTPLNGVVGLSQILLDSHLSSLQRQQLQTIYLSAVTLGNIFNDIIDLDKLGRSSFNVTQSELGLPALMNDIEYLAQLQLDTKGLELSVNKPKILPEWIETDPTRLRQILWNLTSNATKFTEKGGVTLGLKVADLTAERCTLVFTVEDTGIGIPKSELDKIFTMYYQVKGNRQATGTGIGLAVSHQFAKALGGRLEVSSRVGEGSCFTLTLPVKRVSPPVTENFSKVRPLKILLVEDVALNVTVATALLEKLGHSIIVAMTGEEALRACRKHDDFDLLLLDIQLPDMTGLELADQLLIEFKSLPPMVALTANVVNGKDDYLRHGILDVIRKPLAMSAITSVFGRLFGDGDGDIGVDADAVHCTGDVPATVPELTADDVLNLEVLNDYCESLGASLFMGSVDLFEQVIPDYLGALESAIDGKNDELIVHEAHKIKGAAGSVGLARLQRLANQLQSPELDDWQAHIEPWFDAFKANYHGDILMLRHWLDERREPQD